MRSIKDDLDDLYKYNKEQEIEHDASNQHCHNCAYWSDPHETEKEPNDRGECQNRWNRKTFGKRPKNRWCSAWSRTYDFPEDHITDEDKK